MNRPQKIQFALDVIRHTFEYGGSSEKYKEEGITSRRFEVFSGFTDGPTNEALKSFCSEHSEYLRIVNGIAVELVQPATTLRPRKSKPIFITLAKVAQKILKRIAKAKVTVGLDAEFYSYNIYEDSPGKQGYINRIAKERALQNRIAPDDVATREWVGPVKKKNKAKRTRNGRDLFEVERGIRLVQIAVPKKDEPSETDKYVFFIRRYFERVDLQSFGLAEFLANPQVKKYVVGPADVQLFSDTHNINCRGIIELQRLATAIMREVIPGIKPRTAMTNGSNVLSIATGYHPPVTKNCGNLAARQTSGWLWDKVNMSSVQSAARLQYCAHDAAAALHTGHVLMTTLKPPDDVMQEMKVEL